MPAPFAIADFAAAVPAVLQDDGGKLYPDAATSDTDLTAVLTPFVLRAFARYSKDRPLEIVSDVASDGTCNLPLPTYPDAVTTAVPVFDPSSSILRSIEYPIAQQPPQYVDPSDAQLYRSPSGYTILLTANSTSEGDLLRITWTALHAADGSTIPDADFLAIVDFAAALAAEQLATIYAQTVDPTMGADVVNYRSKSSEYQGLAKMLRKRYFLHMGVDETAAGDTETKPALSIGQQYLEMQSGVDRLIHSRYSR